jgi:DNA polymerase III alpha subunit
MDIDIDLPTTFVGKEVFPSSVPASMVRNEKLTKHNCGFYFQNIPVDEITGVAAIPYKDAEDLGYFKIDFLHLSLLDNFTSKQQIRDLLKKEPDWSLLLNKEIVEQLFQVNREHLLLKKIKPRSVEELADCIALMRPGKRHLVPEYIDNKEFVRNNKLYTKTDDGYSFKRSHAIAYALTIILQLHLFSNKK